MATIANQYQDEDDDGSTTSVSTNSGGASSQGGAGSASPISNVKQNAGAQNNQGYTDVASYLNANQGGSSQLGTQVANNLNTKYSQTKQGAQDSFGQFQTDVNSGYVPENTDLINQVASDPLAAANNQGQFDAYQKQLNDTYTGPNTWGDFGTQQGKVNSATQYADLSKTPGGLNVYAQEVEGANGGPQSAGINALDTLLLGGDSNAIGQVQGAASKYGDLNDFINQMNTQGLSSIGDARTAAQNTSQHALDAFTGANGTLTNFNTQLNNQASTAQSKAITDQQALAKALTDLVTPGSKPPSATGAIVPQEENMIGTYGGGLTPWYDTTNMNIGDLDANQLAQLGLTPDQWSSLRSQISRAGTSEYKTGHNFGAGSPTTDIDLNDFTQQLDPNMINASTVASKGDYDKMAAINKLLGSKTPQNTAINSLNSSLAGTAPTDLTNFNYDNALDYSTGVSDAARQAAQDMANQLTGQADKAHADSQHNRGFLGSNFGDLLGSAVNPVSWIPNALNLIQNKQVSGTNVWPEQLKK